MNHPGVDGYLVRVSPTSVWFACGVQDEARHEEKDRLTAETEETKAKLSERRGIEGNPSAQ